MILYSEATITDILSPAQLSKAQTLSAQQLSTVWFENKNGRFIQRPLPIQANFTPVDAILVNDFNNDGNPDILLGGNIDEVRIKIGKIDASYGILLAGDGKGNFQYVDQIHSGLQIKGCIEDLINMKFWVTRIR